MKRKHRQQVHRSRYKKICIRSGVKAGFLLSGLTRSIGKNDKSASQIV
jgi:hypothetical protein